ncbi:MAG: FtsX-like permease family protein [Anaerolineales bacterium]|nr:FtsX-like permease family protein [Anaerolineales bacterium]
MGVIWNKVWFDLWHNKTRTLLVVFSIAVGVFAIGAIYGMADLMIPTMNADHISINSAPIRMYLVQPIDRDSALALKDVPGVADVEPIAVINVRYKRYPKEPWKLASIEMRDDFSNQIFDVLQLKEGQWPEKETISIERMHSPFYHIGIGDQVIFEVDKREQSFLVTGKIRASFVPPPETYDWAWFFMSPQGMQHFGIAEGNFTQLRIAIKPYSADYARQVATQIKEELAKQGISVAATMYLDPYKHYGYDVITGVTLVMKVMAVLSILLSIVLVFNTMISVITQQTNQIGILKAIGGSNHLIISIYLAGAAFYGFISLLISLPLGVLTAYFSSKVFLGMYNIDFGGFTYSTKAVVFQVIAALVVPLVASLIPVLHGAGITVREAISSYGLGADFKSGKLDRGVEHTLGRFLASQDAIALTNTFRRKGRLALTQGVLVTAGVMFLIVMSISTSITATIDMEYKRRDYDLTISFKDFQRIERVEKLVYSVPGVKKVTLWCIVPVMILRDGEKIKDAGMGSQIQGVVVSDPFYHPQIVAGRWLDENDDRAVVLNDKTAEDNNIQVGDTIGLDMGAYGKQSWNVVGLYRVFMTLGGSFNNDAIYAPRQAVLNASHLKGGSLLLARTEGHSQAEVKPVMDNLESVFVRNNIEVASSITMPQERKSQSMSLEYLVYLLTGLALIITLVGGIGLMGSLSISVIERTKEIGVLRAIGAQTGVILRMYMLEGITQAMLSWLIAVPLSLLTAPLMSDALGRVMLGGELDHRFNIAAVFIWLGVMMLVGVLASIVPARHASQVSVRQCLVYE